MNEIKYLLAVFIQWTWRGGSAARREKARFFPSSRFVTIASLTWFRVIAYGIECWNRGCLDEQDFPPSISTSLERFEFFFFHLNLGAESSEISFRTKELFLWKSKGLFSFFSDDTLLFGYKFWKTVGWDGNCSRSRGWESRGWRGEDFLVGGARIVVSCYL